MDLSASDSQTDFNLIKYFSLIGKPDIHKNRYSDLFFCNCNLGYRKGNYSGNMTRRVLENDSQEMKELVDIPSTGEYYMLRSRYVCCSDTNID